MDTDQMIHKPPGNLNVLHGNAWNGNLWGWGPVDQYHGEAAVMQCRKIFVHQPIRKDQQAIGIMWTDRGLHVIPAAGMVGGNDQVITFFTYNRLHTVQERHEEIIM